MRIPARRALTIPIYFVLAASSPILLIVLPLAGTYDLVRRSDWATVRAFSFFTYYVLCEAIGIVAAALLWIDYRCRPSTDHADFVLANFRLQCWWATALFRGMERIFAIHADIEGDEEIQPGPIVVYSRHVSTADTILPAVFISSRHDILLRYVLKKELLWDPCLDIVGNRLRNYFVDRHSIAREKEVEEVASLADDLGPGDGVLIYPEGTRFSRAKRARAIEHLAIGSDRHLLNIAQSMQNVLPPKLGGPIALLERNSRADVVVLAHTGLEGVESMVSLLDGSLVRRQVRVRFWRIPRHDIPTDPMLRKHWLFETWAMVDRWISQNRDRPTYDLTDAPVRL